MPQATQFTSSKADTRHPNSGHFLSEPSLSKMRSLTVKEEPINHPSSLCVSAYQKFIRDNAEGKITDHICKEMNEQDMERTKYVRSGAKGADWHDIPDLTFKGSPLIPPCLRPKPTGKTNNWHGLFGRLDYDDVFPTCTLTTEVGPMRKVDACTLSRTASCP
jgi:hypothetical protein